MNKIIVFFVAIFIVISCEDDPIEVVEPKDYIPAYPGSYWDYTDGGRVSVNAEYVMHSYQYEVNSTSTTDEVLVPQIGSEYIYEYGITQNSIAYPLKQLLSESVSSSWVVNRINEQDIYRKTIESIDSMYIKIPTGNTVDSTLYVNTLVVVEYMDSLGDLRWNTKEYYSQYVGLIRVEINNPYDTLEPVVQKQLLYSHINN